MIEGITKIISKKEMSVKDLLKKEKLFYAVSQGLCHVLVDGNRIENLEQKITSKNIIAIIPHVEGARNEPPPEPKRKKKNQNQCPLLGNCDVPINKEHFTDYCIAGKYSDCQTYQYFEEWKTPEEWLKELLDL